LTTVERPLETLPLTLKLPLAGAGDRQVQIDVRSGDQVLSRRTVGVSAAQRRDQRLQALPAEWPAELPPLERATLTHLTTLLRGLAAGDAPETDYPANRLLAEVESTLNGERYDARRPGTHWLAVPVGERRVVTRVQVPKGLANGPKALVVALHGAGGSENMFFDAYGVGIVARESARRDWMMIAPRDDNVFQPPPLPGLIDALVDRYPIDAKRVLLVGHSMGAARAVAAARTHPQRFAAVAALGGGGNARGAKALQDRPFLIGYGREDFLKRSALLLVNDLRLAKADLRVIEYPDVEHLSVVAAAADDLFRFFDALAR
jgi:pimeloyl-ACP methyl ester carboxylesterase